LANFFHLTLCLLGLQLEQTHEAYREIGTEEAFTAVLVSCSV